MDHGRGRTRPACCVADSIRLGARYPGDPVTFIAVGLVCGSLRAALQVPAASTTSSALLTVEIAAIACAFYFLWRRTRGSRV